MHRIIYVVLVLACLVLSLVLPHGHIIDSGGETKHLYVFEGGASRGHARPMRYDNYFRAYSAAFATTTSILGGVSTIPKPPPLLVIMPAVLQTITCIASFPLVHALQHTSYAGAPGGNDVETYSGSGVWVGFAMPYIVYAHFWVSQA